MSGFGARPRNRLRHLTELNKLDVIFKAKHILFLVAGFYYFSTGDLFPNFSVFMLR